MSSSPGDSFPAPGSTTRLALDRLAAGRFIMGPDPTPPMPEVPGFEIIHFIARGSLGQVWEAVRTADQVRVALKIAVDTRPEISERLTAEAGALQVLEHPHIIRLLDITSTTDDRAVLVLEFVEGPNLAARLPASGFLFEHALQILLPVLTAVEHAHAQGLIHRDLKPANILIGPEGQPKVADFGLALPLQDRLVIFALTASGAVAGTVEYLAPECYLPGYEPAVSADIYALGVLSYELLTGTPPRGAWQPLSQIRKLDVRLDELMADAIHPDPAKRLASARLFRERLETIRATRPRLAGTPLVNRAVRAADLFWTIGGLYLCAAGFCATLSHTRTPVPALFDLTFSSPGLLLRGFLAVWVLSLGIGLLWLWQMFRLWRFRHVPLRESLPSPFGMRLGTSPMAAAWVALTQFLCAWLPPVFVVVVMSQTFKWWSPETPGWDKFLVVTPWMTDEPVSPWHWDPAKLLDGGAYWLKEALQGYEPGALRITDKTSFFIFGQPFLMVLCAVITGLGMVATGGVWLRSWWRDRRAGAVLTFITLAAGGCWFTATVRAEVREWMYPSPRYVKVTESQWRFHSVFEALDRVCRNRFLHQGTPILSPDPLEALFAEEVAWLHLKSRINLSTVNGRLRNDRKLALAENRHIDVLGTGSGLEPSGRVNAVWTYLVFTDPAAAPATARRITMTWRGRMTGPFTAKISSIEQKILPLYEASPKALTLAEAHAFVAQWAGTLSADSGSALQEYFLPRVLTEDQTARPSSELLAVFDMERSKWTHYRLTLAEPLPEPERLPGARWRLRPVFRQEGRHPGKAASDISPPLRWIMDIAHVENRWRIVGFTFDQ